ncbi:MAG: hypothetical protein WAL56_15775 [Candidatus Sulfotelmatobacter sp.]
MKDREELKLIAAYDRNQNEYFMVAHNQSPDEAERYLEKWGHHLREGYSLIVLGQAKHHRTEQEQDCKACRETVARSAHLQPQPKFKRRSE